MLRTPADNPAATRSPSDAAADDAWRCQLRKWNDTQSAFPDESCISELFEAQVERTPDAVALVFGRNSISYRKLDEHASRLANYLRGHGVGPEVLVGLCVQRSPDSIVGMLGILKAGGAYVPLDPAYPKERLALMLSDAAVRVLLTQEAVRNKLPESDVEVISLDSHWARIAKEEATHAVTGAKPDDLAYVIYTSGSTGEPKGVAMSHRPVSNLIAWQSKRSVLGAAGRTLQLTSLSFDVSVQEIFATLCTGGVLVLVAEDLRRNSKALLELIVRESIERIFLPFSPLQQLAETALRERIVPSSLREIVTAGEQLRVTPQISALFQQLDACSLYNQYGPTETHVIVTSFCMQGPPEDWPELPPIGRPIANTQIHILDQQLHPVPIGDIGELYIGGVCLARGYLNQPALNTKRFVADPFSARPEVRLYRSGDFGRHLPDGNIEFLGRIDDQVKIRGFRIELGEVEAALNRHTRLRQAAVIASTDAVGDRRLVAYFVPDPKQTISTNELRQFLSLRLPDYMVPSVFVSLRALPLTQNAKLDRRALPPPEFTRSALSHPFCPPESSVERTLTAIWEEVLGLDQVGVNDDFFELGGDSLKATRVLARVNARLQIEVSHKTFCELPTIAEIAGPIEAAQQSAPPQAPVRRPKAPARSSPLAFGQDGIWVAARFQRNEPVYNESFTIHFKQAIDALALERALSAFVQRHDVLRTGFCSQNGMVTQHVYDAVELKLGIMDMGAMAKDLRAEHFAEQAHRAARLPFDMMRPPLLRATFFRFDETDCKLHLVFHHIVCDASSVYDVLLPELYTLYRAFSRQSSVMPPPLRLRYADYIHWQRAYLESEVIEQDRLYWEEQLHGIEPLELPTDSIRPPQCSYRGEFMPLSLSKGLSDALADLSRKEGVTVYMLLLAAFDVLLLRYTGQDDVVVATVKVDRQRPEFESLFGYFLNTLMIRADLAGNPRFDELLARVRTNVLDAFAHWRYPFVKLAERFSFETDSSRHPLFRAAFVMEPSLAVHVSGWSVSQLDVQSGTSKFDLMLEVEQRVGGIIGRFEYSTDLFTRATIARMVAHFQTLLEGIVEAPGSRLSDLPLLTAVEREKLLSEWNDTTVPYPRDMCIHEVFEDQTKCASDAVAVIDAHNIVTYGELNSRANQLAHYLRGLGVGRNILVGLYIERSVEMIVAILGILKAGGAYVPLDPSYPARRLAFMLEETQAPVIVTQAALLGRLPTFQGHVVRMDADRPRIEREVESNPPQLTGAQDYAYIMYTSGSTGMPKGVAVPHRGVLRLVRGARYVEFGPEQTYLLLAPISFDASTFELWGALLHGARCVVFPDRVPSLHLLEQTIRDYGVTTLWLTAALFNTVIDEAPEILTGIRQLLTGGEALSLPHIRRAKERLPETEVINGYGPTEGTSFTCCYSVPRMLSETLRSVPIGRPISNTQVYVLDHYLNPVPIGVPGELYIGGDGLANGYLNQPGLTAQRFVVNLFSSDPEARLYKTGDRVRYLTDGTIEFLGRLDGQLKIRGFRIEPGEIEAALREHPAVAQAVAMARSDGGAPRLVAYIVPSSTDMPTPNQLQDLLKLWLPEYMVPSAFVFVERLPLTPSGKVDRTALAVPIRSAAGRAKTGAAPRNAIEVQIMRIWEQLFDVSPIGVEDNFFDLGGHSLLAVQLMDRIQQLFDRELPLDALWYSPGTIRHLAELLTGTGGEPVWSRPVAIKPSGNKSPLFCLPIAGGHLFNYDNLSRYIDPERPVYALPPQGVDGKRPAHTSIEDMAKHAIQQMRDIQPTGPYHLTGYCSGGVIAFEVARQLLAQGDDVAFLGLIDSISPSFSKTFVLMLKDLVRGNELRLVQERLYALVLNTIGLPHLRKVKGVGESHRWALWSYKKPPSIPGRITLFRPASYEYSRDAALGWASLAEDGVEVHLLPGRHRDLMREPDVKRFAAQFNQCLAGSSQEPGGNAGDHSADVG
ncbi:MAG: amino acid adenylation domain-containing protein [Gammaproteobacteria bacterium]